MKVHNNATDRLIAGVILYVGAVVVGMAIAWSIIVWVLRPWLGP